LCNFIGNQITQQGGRIIYTRQVSYRRANEADGFSVTSTEVYTSYTVAEGSP